MSRWVFYIPQVLVISIVSIVYLHSVFKRRKDTLQEDRVQAGDGLLKSPGGALRKEMDATNQEIITDGAMLVSFPLVIYTILLPGILAGSKQVFSVINMIIAGSGMIAMIFLVVKILGRLKRRAELKRRYGKELIDAEELN